MNKISLIIQREYITRVRNKTFILSTFLFPIIMIGFIIGSAFFAVNSRERLKVAVVNDPGFFRTNLKSDSTLVTFQFDATADSLNYLNKGYDGILYLPSKGTVGDYELKSKKQFGMDARSFMERQLNKAIENNMLQQKGIDKILLDSIENVSNDAVVLKNTIKEKSGNNRQANAGLAYGIGFGSGILIYITMFIFGAMVMRGVAEEKTNRIAEVIVSSCKPFELMLGKIIGIAGVGLTQLLLWIGLLALLSTSLQFIFTPDLLHQAQQAQSGGISGNSDLAIKIMQTKNTITESVNWLVIIPCFVFYFLGGYLFYAALFAAIGSVINEDPQEAQSLMLPITMPIIFGFIILNGTLQNPNSSTAVWASIIPFTSPIVMMGRIPFGVPETVPLWQLVLSMVSLIGGFLITTWFAGKIYRVGILMYGKKPSWKEMIKWVFRKS